MIKINDTTNSPNINKNIFEEIYNDKKKFSKEKASIYDLGPGYTNLIPPLSLREELCKTVMFEDIHDYPNMEGDEELLKSIIQFYLNRYHVRINSYDEIALFHGSKEGIAKVALAYTNPGDVVLVPNPSYPVFEQSAIINRNNIRYIPLLASNGFYPDFDSIPKKLLESSKIFFINYPNVPTTANTNRSIFEKIVELALQYNFIIVNDATYSNIYFDKNAKPMSIFEIDGASDCAVEFNSFSQMFGISGWRIGFAIGDSKLLNKIKFIDKLLDSGVFVGFQKVAAFALKRYEDFVYSRNALYHQKQKLLNSNLTDLGLEVFPSTVTYYSWVKLPKHNSYQVYTDLLNKASVMTMPGIGFGANGEGYLRFCFARKDEEIISAVNNIKKEFKNIF